MSAGCATGSATGAGRDGAAVIAFALSVLLVYMVLAGQYESWLLPLAVIGAARVFWFWRNRVGHEG